jgi:hypothetical protein
MCFIIYFFLSVFGRFYSKTAAANLPANHFNFSAGSELFCRIFGRPATVHGHGDTKEQGKHTN